MAQKRSTNKAATRSQAAASKVVNAQDAAAKKPAKPAAKPVPASVVAASQRRAAAKLKESKKQGVLEQKTRQVAQKYDQQKVRLNDALAKAKDAANGKNK
jgi:hypothetical protein